MANTEEMLSERHIRPTAVRILILRKMAELNCAVSQAQLEELLHTVDKSTISRTLAHFVDKHLAHRFAGSDGVTLYALCPPQCHCHDQENPSIGDMHVHFTCDRCGRTFCMRTLPVPVITLPSGFTVSTANYLLRGICAECAAKVSHD